jgi:hypothetical protein
MNTLKLILSIVTISLLTVQTYSQTEKGKILVGGKTNLNLTSINSKLGADKSDGGSTTSIQFSPELGIFVFKGFALGLTSQIGFTTEKGSGSKYNTTSLVFAPFIKNYFGTNHIKPYLQGAIGLGNSKRKNHYQISPTEYHESTSSTNIFLYEVDGGIGMFFNDRLSLDIQLGYTHTSSKPKASHNNANRVISSGIGFGAGFTIIL